MMTLGQIGEFGLLQRLPHWLNRGPKAKILQGPGDDAFVAQGSKKCLVATTDMLIEDVHFKRSWATAEDIGYKSMVVNLSDLAAMGAVTPLYALVAMGVPSDLSMNYVEKLLKSMDRLSNNCGLTLVGGDTVRSKHIVISITLIGEADRENIVYRSGANVGDKLFVTGTFGDSHAGLEILKGSKLRIAVARKLAQRHVRPWARFKEGELLGRHRLARALMDCSDGFVPSLRILCQASGVGADVRLEDVPVSGALKTWAASQGQDPWQHVFQGGEDYELLFAVPLNKVKELERRLPSVTLVGEVKPKHTGVRLHWKGTIKRLDHGGFDHFRNTQS